MRQETTLSPTSPGAGRMWDFVWPEEFWATGVPANGRNRQGLVVSSSGGVKGATGGGTTVGIVNGADIINYSAGTATGDGPFSTFGGCIRAHIITSKGGVAPTITNDFAAWRVYMVASFSSAPAANADMGLAMLTGSEAFPGLLLNSTPGFGLYATSDGAISFVRRGGLGLVVSPLTNPATFDITKYHTYEMRTISATATAEAVLKLLIDNIVLATFNWGAGTSLPSGNAANLGFWASVCNFGANRGMYVQQVRGIASQTEAGTL